MSPPHECKWFTLLPLPEATDWRAKRVTFQAPYSPGALLVSLLEAGALTRSGEPGSGKWVCSANHKESNKIIRNYQDHTAQEEVSGSSHGVFPGSALRVRDHPNPPAAYVMRASEKWDVKGFENCQAL